MLRDGEKWESEEPRGSGAEVWELKAFHGMKGLEELGSAVHFASGLGIFSSAHRAVLHFLIAAFWQSRAEALQVFCSQRAQILQCLLILLTQFAVPVPLCCQKSHT